MSSRLQKEVQRFLAPTGVKINGKRPFDITVHNPKFYGRVLSEGSLGLGESYMDGWWDCEQLDELFFRILREEVDKQARNDWSLIRNALLAKLLNMQNKRRAQHVGKQHYDIGNDLFEAMLDKRMTYTCGYWRQAKNLDDAQEAKLDLVCRKLNLKPGMTVLDIGCGWGSFAKYAAQHYGVKVVGVTIAKEQVALARELCKGLPIKILLQDYRDVRGSYDRIVSIGMFEHVGYKNYRTFMEIVHRCLKDDGLFLLHTIGSNKTTTICDPWFDKYIFPHGMLPSVKQLGEVTEGLFVMEDWHNFGADYEKTLQEWFHNFDKRWPTLNKQYDERFYRMWKYYLLSIAGAFRARKVQLWQVVLSKKGVRDGYQSVR